MAGQLTVELPSLRNECIPDGRSDSQSICLRLCYRRPWCAYSVARAAWPSGHFGIKSEILRPRGGIGGRPPKHLSPTNSPGIRNYPLYPVSTTKQCIDICRACERTCLETMCYCLSKGGKHADPAHILMLQSCADMCATCSRSMISGSKLHSKICSTCSEVCAACARDCMTMQEDAQTSKCIESCQQCAESCGKMGA
jgi:hypothetical protein